MWNHDHLIENISELNSSHKSPYTRRTEHDSAGPLEKLKYSTSEYFFEMKQNVSDSFSLSQF